MPRTNLKNQWLSLCSQIGIQGAAEWESLSAAYTLSGLAYHNLDHIADCLEKFRQRAGESSDPIAVELAIWFHDAIYDPKAADNEEQSARLASVFLKDTPHHETVSNLIIATKHTYPEASPDSALLCDIDLSIFGSPSPLYQQYSLAIRNEYSWVPDAEYRTGRAKVLHHFLDRDCIYALPKSRELYESQARQNLSEEILRLQVEN